MDFIDLTDELNNVFSVNYTKIRLMVNLEENTLIVFGPNDTIKVKETVEEIKYFIKYSKK